MGIKLFFIVDWQISNENNSYYVDSKDLHSIIKVQVGIFFISEVQQTGWQPTVWGVIT